MTSWKAAACCLLWAWTSGFARVGSNLRQFQECTHRARSSRMTWRCNQEAIRRSGGKILDLPEAKSPPFETGMQVPKTTLASGNCLNIVSLGRRKTAPLTRRPEGVFTGIVLVSRSLFSRCPKVRNAATMLRPSGQAPTAARDYGTVKRNSRETWSWTGDELEVSPRLLHPL